MSMLKKWLFIFIIIVFFLSLELYLHKRQEKEGGTIPNIGVCTHNGAIVAEGSFKVCLAPYTIYKNCPNQKIDEEGINSKGFRGSEVSNVLDKRKRIIVVGGSAAMGTGIATNETFEAMMEGLNPHYEVINAGVVGFLSGQELAYTVTELVDYHPQIIIAFDGWNDLHEQWYHSAWFSGNKEKDEIGFNNNFFCLQIEKKLIDNYKTETSLFQSFGRFFNTVVAKSILLSRLRIKVARAMQHFTLAKDSRGKNKAMEPSVSAAYFTEIVNTYTNNLRKMNDFCKSQGIKFAVVFQPELGCKANRTAEEQTMLTNYAFGSKNYSQEFPALYRRFMESSKDILKKHEVEYVDINETYIFSSSSKTLFTDAVHTSKNGNQIIAEIINAYLAKILPAAAIRD
jgi:lysophospholipase L1-like esterase